MIPMFDQFDAVPRGNFFSICVAKDGLIACGGTWRRPDGTIKVWTDDDLTSDAIKEPLDLPGEYKCDVYVTFSDPQGKSKTRYGVYDSEAEIIPPFFRIHDTAGVDSNFVTYVYVS